MKKDIWFKRKKYGWGWTPSNFKGWLVTGLYVLIVTSYPLSSELGYTAFSPTIMMILIATLTPAFIYICYKKGEAPAWQWGNKSS